MMAYRLKRWNRLHNRKKFLKYVGRVKNERERNYGINERNDGMKIEKMEQAPEKKSFLKYVGRGEKKIREKIEGAVLRSLENFEEAFER